MKTSDLVDGSGQVPDFGEVAQVAPQLFDMTVGSISGPINAGRTGVVVKILDKQEPTPTKSRRTSTGRAIRFWIRSATRPSACS